MTLCSFVPPWDICITLEQPGVVQASMQLLEHLCWSLCIPLTPLCIYFPIRASILRQPTNVTRRASM